MKFSAKAYAFGVESLVKMSIQPFEHGFLYGQFEIHIANRRVSEPARENEYLPFVCSQVARFLQSGRLWPDPKFVGLTPKKVIALLHKAIYGDTWDGPETVVERARRFNKYLAIDSDAVQFRRLVLVEHADSDLAGWCEDDEIHHAVLPPGLFRTVARNMQEHMVGYLGEVAPDRIPVPTGL